VIEFYPQIKWVHVAAALLSGGLFLLRGALVQSGRGRFALAAPLRYLSWSIDTVLLTAALMLATMLPAGFFANGWLAAKLLLLVLYVALATLALRSPRPRRRGLAFAAALGALLAVVAIARAHHPLGPLAAWLA
jgi:uncharacterized membrane protein SirB2